MGRFSQRVFLAKNSTRFEEPRRDRRARRQDRSNYSSPCSASTQRKPIRDLFWSGYFHISSRNRLSKCSRNTVDMRNMLPSGQEDNMSHNAEVASVRDGCFLNISSLLLRQSSPPASLTPTRSAFFLPPAPPGLFKSGFWRGCWQVELLHLPALLRPFQTPVSFILTPPGRPRFANPQRPKPPKFPRRYPHPTRDSNL